MAYQSAGVQFVKLENAPRQDFEAVERKGVGHPDTLSDALAEELSRVYSNYTLSNFGAVLHHNFDKVGLLGGASHVEFGKGYLTRPIRVLLNGRASWRFGDVEIPLKHMLERTASDFLVRYFPTMNPEKDIEIHYNMSSASSPGKVDETAKKEGTRKRWFEPRGLDDLRELKFLASNDTSLGCGYAPLSQVERLVLEIEGLLNSPDYKKSNPWIGSDIKVMASRVGEQLDVTMCVPQIADHVPNIEAYQRNLKQAEEDAKKIMEKYFDKKASLRLNTRDDFEACELYLTALGSSIESGDEGLVGRGNRINGLITPCRPMSIEGACGKNPVYHIGKLYNIAAREIAEHVSTRTGHYTEVYLISQSGRLLEDPWKTLVVSEAVPETDEIPDIVYEGLKDIHKITGRLLKGEVRLF